MTERPELQRGDRVLVREQGIQPWTGTVNAVKPSKVSGWWVDVDRDDVGVWSICLKTTDLEVVSQAAPRPRPPFSSDKENAPGPGGLHQEEGVR